MQFFFALIFLVAVANSAELTRQRFLLSFPEISYDEHKVVFSNDKWSAVFSGAVGAMFTVPKDSIDLPVSQSGRNCRVVVGNSTYACNPVLGNSIVRQDPFGNSDKTITPPNQQALNAFANAWRLPQVSRGEVSEEIGPLFADREKIWFGLLAYHGAGKDPVAGLGWYDPATDQFGRIYSPELVNFAPRWLGLREDTLWVYCKASGAEAGGKLIWYSVGNGALGMVDTKALGVPGDTLLNVGLWKSLLLLCTDQAVSVWPMNERPWVWQTNAYASKDGTYLKFVTFDTKKGLKFIGDNFFPLRKNTPAQAFAQVGDMVLLYAPSGVEATMPAEQWNKRKSVLTSADWGCGDQLCFARVRMSTMGAQKEMDLLDTPLAPLDAGPEIAKVGMRAGWVPLRDLVPVLIKQ